MAQVTAGTATARPRAQETQDALVRFFKGLGNAGRLRVLEALRQGELCVSDVVAQTALPQAQVSTALSCLRWCGFVDARQDGRRVYYRIASERVGEILRLAELMVSDHAQHLYSCVVLGEEQEQERQFAKADLHEEDLEE